MSSKSKLIRTLSTVAALATIVAPTNSRAEDLPSVELNFEALEQLKHQEEPKAAAQATVKKETAKTSKKETKSKKQAKTKPVEAKKHTAKKVTEHHKEPVKKAAKLPEPTHQEKPAVEVKKDTLPQAIPTPTPVEKPVIEIPKDEVVEPTEPVQVEPTQEEKQDIGNEPKKPAVEINQDPDSITPEQQEPSRTNIPGAALWKKIPFLTKKDEPKQEAVAPIEASVTPEVKAETPVAKIEEKLEEPTPAPKENVVTKSKDYLLNKIPFMTQKDEPKEAAAPEVRAEKPIEPALEEKAATTKNSLLNKIPFLAKKEEPNQEAPAAIVTPEVKVEAPIAKIEEEAKEPAPVDQEKSVTENRDSLWNKIPFASKKSESPAEDIKNGTASLDQKKDEAKNEIYDDSKLEEFIDQKAPGIQEPKAKTPDLDNVSVHTQAEIEREHAKEALRQAKINAKRAADEMKIKNSKLASDRIQKAKNQNAAQTAPAENSNSVEQAQNIQSNEVETEGASSQNPDKEANTKNQKKVEVAVAEKTEKSKKTDDASDEDIRMNEQSWQQFLSAAKKKATSLSSSPPAKHLDEHINSDSIVALKHSQELAKEAAQKAEPAPTKEVAAIAEKTEENAAPKAEQHDEIVKTVTANENSPAPVITKKDKASLSSLMDKMPYFNDNKTDLKNDAVSKKIQEAKKEPEIPAIHEVKAIPVETASEAVEANISKEKSPGEKGLFGKLIDKKLTAETESAEENNVVISSSTDKKLNDAIDKTIVASKEITEEPVIPEPAAGTPATESAKEPEKTVTQNSAAASSDSSVILSIVFDSNNTGINDVDKERLNKLVSEMLSSSKRFKIVSYAQGIDGEPNSARKISLQRAVAVRTQMIATGLEKNRINVQAAGQNTANEEFANSVNIYELP